MKRIYYLNAIAMAEERRRPVSTPKRIGMTALSVKADLVMKVDEKGKVTILKNRYGKSGVLKSK